MLKKSLIAALAALSLGTAIAATTSPASAGGSYSYDAPSYGNDNGEDPSYGEGNRYGSRRSYDHGNRYGSRRSYNDGTHYGYRRSYDNDGGY